jgi:DNA-directed RNA polymerase subunit RPC12/RpoP
MVSRRSTATMPANHFFCVICGTPLSAELGTDARLMDCPNCRHVVPIPGAADLLKGFSGEMPVFPRGVLAIEMKFLCSSCGRKLQVDARWQDRAVTCPNCQSNVTVPVWSREPAPPALTAEEMDFLAAISQGDVKQSHHGG